MAAIYYRTTANVDTGTTTSASHNVDWDSASSATTSATTSTWHQSTTAGTIVHVYDDYYTIYGGRYYGDPNHRFDLREQPTEFVVGGGSHEPIKVEDSEAEKKAKELLKLFIGEDQLAVYEKTGRVLVKAPSGNKYIVRKDRMVQKLEDTKIIDLCVHIKHKYNCPPTDHVVALKLLLEGEEDYILKLANRRGSESLPEELPLAACM